MIPRVILEVSLALILVHLVAGDATPYFLIRILSTSCFNSGPRLNSDAIGPCFP